MGLFTRRADLSSFMPTRPGPILGEPGRWTRHIVAADPILATAIPEDERVLAYALAEMNVVALTEQRFLFVRRGRLQQVALDDVDAVHMRSRAMIYTLLFEPPTAGIDMVRFGMNKEAFGVVMEIRDLIRDQLARRGRPHPSQQPD